METTFHIVTDLCPINNDSQSELEVQVKEDPSPRQDIAHWRKWIREETKNALRRGLEMGMFKNESQIRSEIEALEAADKLDSQCILLGQ